MPIRSAILSELQPSPDPPDVDAVRRKHLHGLSQRTGRDVILYPSGWVQQQAPPRLTSIIDEDIQPLMDACADDEIVMAKHSFLGPTDPQVLLQTHLGLRLVPAQAISSTEPKENALIQPSRLHGCRC